MSESSTYRINHVIPSTVFYVPISLWNQQRLFFPGVISSAITRHHQECIAILVCDLNLLMVVVVLMVQREDLLSSRRDL